MAPNFVDEIIEKARARGEFENLPGEGRPLELEENPYGGETELGYRVLKQSGFTPAFIEERQQLHKQMHAWETAVQKSGRLRHGLPWQRLRWTQDAQRLRIVGEKLNQKIQAYNLKTPTPLLQLLPLDIDKALT